jgi:hypothetical protein
VLAKSHPIDEWLQHELESSPQNYLELNVDAHSLGDACWWLGLIIRGEDGSCIGTAMKLVRGSDETSLAEV